METGLLDGMETLVLESNHDVDMLAKGPYPYALRQRVGGDLGHLANAQTFEILASSAPKSLKRLVLAHLSLKNNTKKIVLETAHAALRQRGLTDVQVQIAPARGPLPARLPQ